MSPSKQRKTFVLDTNVLLHDPRAVFAFDDNNVVIPMIVLEEIDRKKDRLDEVGANARYACRIFDELRSRGRLNSGVPLQSGATLRVLSVEDFQGVLPDELNDDHPDNMIITVAVGLQDGDNEDVCVVTKDVNMRIKCNVVDMQCDDYRRFQVVDDTSELYTGILHRELPGHVVDKLNAGRKRISVDELGTADVHPNQFIVDEASGNSLRVDVCGNELLHVGTGSGMGWVEPRNLEQRLALRLLYDDRVKLVTLIGGPGSGKTLLSIAAGLDLMAEQNKYSKVLISRPIQPVGRDLGYLPGTKEEKMEPWLQPIYDNIEFLFNDKMGFRNSMFSMWMEKGMVEIEALTYIRGRSIANAFILLDEGQNLSAHEVRTLVTRIGEGTKLVITGDINQIDNNFVGPLSNGLTYVVERFRSEGIAGHITLKKGERSDLASLAAKLL